MNNHYSAGSDNLNKFTIKDYNLNTVNWYLSHFPRHQCRRYVIAYAKKRNVRSFLSIISYILDRCIGKILMAWSTRLKQAKQ